MNPITEQLTVLTETDGTSRVLAYRVSNPDTQPVVAGLFVFQRETFTLLALQDLHLKPGETVNGLLSLPLADLGAADLDVRLLVRSVLASGASEFTDVLPVARLSQSGQTVTFRATPEAGTRGLLVVREDAHVLGLRPVKADADWTGQLRLERASSRAVVTAYVETVPAGPPPPPPTVTGPYWINPRGVSRLSTGLHTSLSAAQLGGLLVQTAPPYSLGVLDYYVPYVATDMEFGPIEDPQSTQYLQDSLLAANTYGMVRHGRRSLQYFPDQGRLGLLDVTTGAAERLFPPSTRLGDSFPIPGVGALDDKCAVSVALWQYGGEQRFVDFFDLEDPTRSFSTGLLFPDGSQMQQPGGEFRHLNPQVLVDHTNQVLWVMDLQPEREEYLVWQVTTADEGRGQYRMVPLAKTRHPVFNASASRMDPPSQARAFTGQEPFLAARDGEASLLRVSHEDGQRASLKVSRLWFMNGTWQTELMVLRSDVDFAAMLGVTIDGNGTVYVTVGNAVHAVPFAPGDVTLGGDTTVGTFSHGTPGSTHTVIALADGALVCRSSEVMLVKPGSPQLSLDIPGASQLELLLVSHTGTVLVREQPGVAT